VVDGKLKAKRKQKPKPLRSHRIAIDFFQHEVQAVTAGAKLAGKPTSTFIREAAMWVSEQLRTRGHGDTIG